MYLWSDSTDAATNPHPFVHSAWPAFTREPRVATRDVRRRHATPEPEPDAGAGADARSHDTRQAWSTSLAPAVSRMYDSGEEGGSDEDELPGGSDAGGTSRPPPGTSGTSAIARTAAPPTCAPTSAGSKKAPAPSPRAAARNTNPSSEPVSTPAGASGESSAGGTIATVCTSRPCDQTLSARACHAAPASPPFPPSPAFSRRAHAVSSPFFTNANANVASLGSFGAPPSKRELRMSSENGLCHPPHATRSSSAWLRRSRITKSVSRKPATTAGAEETPL
mmetsp:Transcript_2056/g.8109  ORF Transcript_2056/g.8109 Transcript_2056/m.8109 type:complete len:279 (-) Transcript_2056:1684-2520(-)